MFAAKQGHVDIVRCLVDNGAKLEIQDIEVLIFIVFIAVNGFVIVLNDIGYSCRIQR